MTSKPINCPFCGREPDVPEASVDGYWVECSNPNCMALIEADTKAEAIKAWNTRADGWISVKDSLPEKQNFVLACNSRFIPDTLRIINPIFLTSAYTHWMPIPQILDAEEE